MPFLTISFFGEGSSTKIDYRIKVGTLILTSLLEDLGLDSPDLFEPRAQVCQDPKALDMSHGEGRRLDAFHAFTDGAPFIQGQETRCFLVCTTVGGQNPFAPLRNHGKAWFVGIYRGTPGFLRWFEMDFVHPQ